MRNFGIMKETLLKLVRAFVALLHTDSDNVTQIAALKAQIATYQAQLTLTDAEQAEVNSAVNQIAAADAPSVADVKPVAAVKPSGTVDANAVALATSQIPADVTAAASVAPTA